jgi:hypothetical protein
LNVWKVHVKRIGFTIASMNLGFGYS